MSQYGQVSSNYYNPVAKFNTIRTSLRYFVLVYDYSSRILNYCSYLIAENAVQYHIDSFPFNFGSINMFCRLLMPANPIQYLIDSFPFNFSLSITKSCKIPTFDTPLEYTDYFLPVIPLDNTVTGNCSLTIDVNQTEYNKLLGVISNPQPFSFGTITSSCISNLSEGIGLDYTPTTPPTALTGLYQQLINNSCSYNMPSNPLQFYINSEAFNFISITQSCSFSTPFDVPVEYTDYFINTIPLDTSVTGSCTLNVDVDQIEYNKTLGAISDPQAFSFDNITTSCEGELEFSDLEDFNISIGQYVPQAFNFGTIDSSCIANISE